MGLKLPSQNLGIIMSPLSSSNTFSIKISQRKVAEIPASQPVSVGSVIQRSTGWANTNDLVDCFVNGTQVDAICGEKVEWELIGINDSFSYSEEKEKVDESKS